VNDKEIKGWTRISIWALRIIIALGFIVAYLVITGRIDRWMA